MSGSANSSAFDHGQIASLLYASPAPSVKRINTTVSLRLRSLILVSLSICAILLGSFVEEANHEASSDVYQSPTGMYNEDTL